MTPVQHIRCPPAPRHTRAPPPTRRPHDAGPREQPRPRRRAAPPRASAGEEGDMPESKLGPNVAAGIRDVQQSLEWRTATVMRNDAISLDGGQRLLHLSVPDDVDKLYGRQMQGRNATHRWIDSYTIPGQYVGLRFPGETTRAEEKSGIESARRLYSIASSPYDSRRDSAYLGASVIEVVVDRRWGADDARFAALAPGDTAEVSQLIGRGFCSLFSSYASLMAALEERRNLLLLAVGARGIAAARAALNWTPVLAHATQHKVTCLYVTRSPSTAAFLPEWDQWREAGVDFRPLYTESLLPDSPRASPAGAANGGADEADAGQEDVTGLLEQGLFLNVGGLEGAVGGRPSECTVLLAGLSGDVASAVAKELTFKGMLWERLLFCEFF
ncbi:hypothetical protein MNEG_11111 [Monoraphidium neglectum]|uniref:Uncharacterized protein n=1 Tax=Monoraphidium neglectum TaxID=145388 RepID=A0A0D2JAU4_9CHLO|nr:hypothetical protein MNEG_11111 [Monoraphidium neglectum]KIY96852.1 hypothetical protein MNEG_11111 [Monoraphidium neglectum]|eukprot:XP_013895872.1 hypothetical protein MNEG_11111 [Monoraphidium neglectum]